MGGGYHLNLLYKYSHENNHILQRNETENSIIGSTRNEKSLFSLNGLMLLDKGDDKALLTTDQDLCMDVIRVETAKHSLFYIWTHSAQ